MKRVQVHTKETIQQQPAPSAPRPAAPLKPLSSTPVKPTAVPSQPPSQSEPAGVTTALNPHLPLISGPASPSPAMAVQPQKHSQPHRHMHVKASTKANHLNWLIERFAERWAESHGLTTGDYAHPSQTSQV